MPWAITAGPDGALWFTNDNNTIGRITTGGAVRAYSSPRIDAPLGITAGDDGALWFANRGNNSIGRITVDGAVRIYRSLVIDSPEWITAGPDGALWFTNPGSNSIGRITTNGQITTYGVELGGDVGSISQPGGITAGPDGAIWFTMGDRIGRITVGGRISMFAGGSFVDGGAIARGSDRALWFVADNAKNQDLELGETPKQPGWIGRITVGGRIRQYPDTSGYPPKAITAGSDGALWITHAYGEIGRVSTKGVLRRYTNPQIDSAYGITSGPDDGLWLVATNSIARISTHGAVKSYSGATCRARATVTSKGG